MVDFEPKEQGNGVNNQLEQEPYTPLRIFELANSIDFDLVGPETPTQVLTCYDGTQLEIPDDDDAIHKLGATWTEIYVDSSKLSKEARRFIIYRPSWIKRFAVRMKQLWRELKA